MPSYLFSEAGVDVVEEGGVLTLCMDRGENLINPPHIALLTTAIDTIEAHPHPKSLIITGKGKFFCNGLDLRGMDSSPTTFEDMLTEYWRLLARVLVLDCQTVAAINGHAFGAGLFLALACDWRIMRTQRGFLNFPELGLGMRLRKAFSELSRAKLSPKTLRLGVLTGKRFDSHSALQEGMIDAECPEAELQQRAYHMAEGLLPIKLRLVRFNPATLRELKMELYTDAYRALTMDCAAHPSLPYARL
jgi:enoyl-CoA hydratase/carnithine racemase